MDYFLKHTVVKRDILELIITVGTKKWTYLCELLHDFLEVVGMCKTQIPHVNGMKFF